MGARVNTAIWMESSQRWRIDVQKDGVRRSFYSSKPGRNGQREANRKTDAWYRVPQIFGGEAADYEPVQLGTDDEPLEQSYFIGDCPQTSQCIDRTGSAGCTGSSLRAVQIVQKDIDMPAG